MKVIPVDCSPTKIWCPAGELPANHKDINSLVSPNGKIYLSINKATLSRYDPATQEVISIVDFPTIPYQGKSWALFANQDSKSIFAISSLSLFSAHRYDVTAGSWSTISIYDYDISSLRNSQCTTPSTFEMIVLISSNQFYTLDFHSKLIEQYKVKKQFRI